MTLSRKNCINGIFDEESLDYQRRTKLKVQASLKAKHDINKFRYFSLKESKIPIKKAVIGKHDPMDRPRVYGLRLPPIDNIAQIFEFVKSPKNRA